MSTWMRFGPNRNLPGSGCLSSFVVVRKRDSVLVGKIGDEKEWGARFYLAEHRPGWEGKARLPATHLEFGESPEDAAKRVMRLQLGQSLPQQMELVQVQSHLNENGLGGIPHWDICFVYSPSSPLGAGQKAMLVDTEYQDISRITEDSLGSGHFWVVKSLPGNE